MTQASVGASIDKGISRTIGTMVACMLAVLVLAPLNQNPLPFLVLTFLIISASAYLGTGSFHPYLFVIGGVTVVMVAVLGFEGQNAAVSKGLARTGEIIVGVVISWASAFAVWPRLASEQLEEQIHDTLSRTADAFDVAAAFVLEGKPPPPSFRPDLDAIGPGIMTELALIPAAAREGRLHRDRAPGQRRLAVHLERLRSTLLPFADPIGSLPNGLVVATRPELRALFGATRDAWAAINRKDSPAACEMALAAIRPTRHTIERRLEALRRSGATSTLPSDEILAFHGILGTLREVESSLNAIARHEVDLVAERATSSPLHRILSFRPDKPRWRYALKTGLAVCFAVTLLNVLQWEGSVSAMITVFIVAQLTIGGSVRKAMLRLVGALSGGLLALLVILFATPHISSLPPFAVIIFVVMFFCAYAYTGPESSSYAGLQTGLAFVLVLLAGPKQEVSIMPGVYRLVGVMLGTTISIGVESVLWPSHAFIELRDRIRESLVGAGRLFRELSSGLRGSPPDRDEWLRRAHEARGRLTGFWQILGEALLEGKEARAAVALDLPIATATEEMMHRIARLAVRIDRPVHSELRDLVEPSLEQTLDRLERTLDRLPSYLDGTAPGHQAAADADGLRDGNLELLDALESARGHHRTLELPEEDVSFFIGLLDAVVRIAQGVSVTCDALARASRA